MAFIDKPEGRTKWRVRWVQPDGTRVSRTCPNKETANTLRRDVEETIARGEFWTPAKPSQPVGIEEVLAAYIRNVARIGAASTVRRYAGCLDIFLEFLRRAKPELAPNFPVESLSKGLLDEAYEYLKKNGRHGRPRKVSSVKKIIEAVQRAWAFGYGEDEFTQKMPPPKILDMVTIQRKRTLAPTWEEMDACIGACHGWHRKLALVLRFTGLRVQQVMLLRWDDFSRDLCRLHIRPTLGKTMNERQGRYIPVSPHLSAELATWGPREGWLIPCDRDQTGPRAREARARDMRRAWKRAGVRAEIEGGQPHHQFRKGFISELKSVGADTEAVEFLVGHDAGIRGVYVDPDRLPLKETVDLVPPWSLPQNRKVIHLAR